MRSCALFFTEEKLFTRSVLARRFLLKRYMNRGLTFRTTATKAATWRSYSVEVIWSESVPGFVFAFPATPFGTRLTSCIKTSSVGRRAVA